MIIKNNVLILLADLEQQIALQSKLHEYNHGNINDYWIIPYLSESINNAIRFENTTKEQVHQVVLKKDGLEVEQYQQMMNTDMDGLHMDFTLHGLKMKQNTLKGLAIVVFQCDIVCFNSEWLLIKQVFMNIIQLLYVQMWKKFNIRYQMH